MKVLHVIPSISIEDGGPSVALVSLAKALSDSDISTTIITTTGEADAGNDCRFATGTAKVIYFRRNFLPYKVAWKMLPWLLENIRRFDIVHVHAVFSFASVTTALIARWKGVPYIIRPLGVLNRWGIKNRRPIAKRISYKLIESNILRKAAFIHFTSAQEAEQAYELDERLRVVPAVTLPLPIEIPQRSGNNDGFLKRFPQLKNVDWILYLSRFDRQKGIELLLKAFATLCAQDPECLLVLAGGGESSYVESLQKQATDLGIQHRVIWPGYLTGVEKSEAFAGASVFVLPSYSESFGIAAAEALASGCACVLSDGIPFAADVAAEGGALLIQCEVDSLTSAIATLLGDAAKREQIAWHGRRYAQEHFSPSAVAAAIKSKYVDLLSPSRNSN